MQRNLVLHLGQQAHAANVELGMHAYGVHRATKVAIVVARDAREANPRVVGAEMIAVPVAAAVHQAQRAELCYGLELGESVAQSVVRDP